MATYTIVDKNKDPLDPGEINSGGTIAVSEGDVFIIDPSVGDDIRFETASGNPTNFSVEFSSSNTNTFKLQIDPDLTPTVNVADNVDLSNVELDARDADAVNFIAGDNVQFGKYDGSNTGADIITIGDGFSTTQNWDTRDGDNSITIGDNATFADITTGDGNDTVVVGNGANTDRIRTNNGDDTVAVGSGATISEVDTGNGSDTVSTASPGITTKNAETVNFGNDIVEGTANNDTIDTSYTGDPDGEVVDGNDAFGAGAPSAAEFNWTDYTDEQDLRNGVSQDTGDVTVTVSYSDVQTNEQFSAENSGGTDSIYVAADEPFNANSAGYIFANGSVDNTTVTMDFAANTGSGFADEVENVSFRISDIDGLSNSGNDFQDIVTVRAYDADGNEVPVVITGGTNHTVDGNTVTASLSNGSAADESGSALFEIAGPAAQIVITYDNGGTTQQAIYVSDVHFDAVPQGADDDVINAGDGNDTVNAGYGDDIVKGDAGNDVLDGQSGNDTVSGGTGNDTIVVGQSDTASGDDGDDTFLIDGAQINGGSMTIVGGEGAEATGDTLNFNGQLLAGSIVYTDPNTIAGRESGTATLLDGTTVTFSEIENIICFVTGTDIETPYGPRKIEQLKAGDLVLTRDCGPQPIRWAGQRTIKTTAATAPIEFMAGAVGNTSRLLVSPQHRMLHTGYKAELYFGAPEVLVAASHMVNGHDIVRRETGRVTYHHFVFDDHQIVTANGAESESYHPGAYSLPGLEDKCRHELFKIFPELRVNPIAYGQSARISVKGQLAPLLAA